TIAYCSHRSLATKPCTQKHVRARRRNPKWLLPCQLVPINRCRFELAPVLPQGSLDFGVVPCLPADYRTDCSVKFWRGGVLGEVAEQRVGHRCIIVTAKCILQFCQVTEKALGHKVLDIKVVEEFYRVSKFLE